MADFLDFLARIALPAVLLVVFLSLRREVRNLVNRVRKVKVPGAEIEADPGANTLPSSEDEEDN